MEEEEEEAAAAEMSDCGNIKNEKLSNKKRMRGDYDGGFFSEKVVILIPDESANTTKEERFEIAHNNIDRHIAKFSPKLIMKHKEKRTRGDKKGKSLYRWGFFNEEVVIPEAVAKAMKKKEEELEIFHNNIALLVAKNCPKMTDEQQDWIDRYNEWIDHCHSGEELFPGGLAPRGPESWDPVARERVKRRNKEHFHSRVLRVAEMAIQSYNENHEGSDFEVVEILSYQPFLYIHEWTHINFRAKPKNASAEDDERSFFAEHLLDNFYRGDCTQRYKISDGVISTCCLLEEGSTTNNNCGHCSLRPEVRHPIKESFVFCLDSTFRVSA